MTRKGSWDFVKAILMFIVIYGHVCPALSGISYSDNWCTLTRITGLFVMPLWFFVSGYFQSSITSVKDLIKKYKRSISRIAIPLIIWGCLLVIINFQDTWYNPDKTDLVNQIIFFGKHSVYRITSFYWFLSALLLCILFGSLMSLILNKIPELGVSLLIISLPIFILSKFDLFYFSFIWFYYGCGMLFRLLEDKVKNRFKNNLILGVFSFISIICIVVGYFFYPRYTFYMKSNLVCDTDLLFILFRYVLCLTASLCALFWIFKIYEKFNKQVIVSYLTSSGQDTLFLYCSHVLLLSYAVKPIVENSLGSQGIFENIQVARYYIVAPVLSVVLYILLLQIAKLLMKYKLSKMLLMGVRS